MIAGTPTGRRARTGAPGVLTSAAAVLLAATYPALAYLGMARLGARPAALLLLAAVALAFAWRWGRPGTGHGAPPWLWASTACLLTGGALLDDPRLVMIYPTLVSLALLVQFGVTLVRPPPMIERLARMRVEELGAAEVRYCRAVTVVWCGFFLANGAVAALLAVHGSRALWALYTGLGCYVVMGALFAAEYVVRKSRFGRFGAGPVDRTLQRLLGRRECP